jgi:hypothetical protein
VLIPDLLRAAPQVRGVLDRYGLRGCGGAEGPHETLGFFAKAHDVPLPRLLEELRAAADLPPEPPRCGCCEADARLADTIYRPFFKAGIAVVLTLGAVWGAYLLLRIAWQQSFGAVGLHEVNAHGHAQIFGWVGLFVMGFAYQAFPRFKHTSLRHPRWAWASLGLMLAGLVGRSVLEPVAASAAWALGPVVAASVLEVAAIAIFIGVLASTWRGSGKPLAVYDYYVVCSLFWFFVQAVYEAVYVAATLSVPAGELVPLVATWQAPLRDLQIHGFALLMILGVSQRLFPNFYGFPAPSPRLSLGALAGINGAVLGEALGLVLMRLHHPVWAVLWYASVLALTGFTLALVGSWRIFSSPEDSDRSLKFLRAAYGWLFVSLAMLVLLPVYQYGLLPALAPASPAAETGFSHAYYGATRHAITVGFISLMIVGVAAKVVPTLNGLDVRALPGLWLPFGLINTGCLLRVAAQTATDFADSPFPFAGVSGLLEVTGLAVWGVHLWRIMAGRYEVRRARAFLPVLPGEPIVPAHFVGDVLQQYPGLLGTFLAFGFTPLANPLLRKTLAQSVTLDRACRLLHVDTHRLLDALNQERIRQGRQRLALPVLDETVTT